MSSAIDEARDAMNAIADRFATDERALRTLTAGAVLGSGLRVDIDIRNHRLTVDEPKGIGGTDEGPSPVELLLASLTACQAITYRVWAMKLGIALDTVAVETEGDMDLRGFLGGGGGRYPRRLLGPETQGQARRPRLARALPRARGCGRPALPRARLRPDAGAGGAPARGRARLSGDPYASTRRPARSRAARGSMTRPTQNGPNRAYLALAASNRIS